MKAETFVECCVTGAGDAFLERSGRRHVRKLLADWQDREDYRGGQRQHAHDGGHARPLRRTGDIKWLHRAMRILERFVHHLSRQHEYCMAEHFDANWNLLPDYNIDRKSDPLRPYGLTPGHFAEWAHLTLKAEAHAIAKMGGAPTWMCPDAEGLFRSAVEKGLVP